MPQIAVVDDHRLFSTALAIALREAHVTVVEPVLSSPGELLDSLVSLQPDVVLLDRDLGRCGSGEDLIEPLTGAGGRVVIVSASLDDVIAGRCLARGAVACVAKNETFEATLATVLTVARGGHPLSDAERFRLIDRWRGWQARTDADNAPFAWLTRREAWVLGRLMAGYSVKDLAEECHLSEATVRSHVHKILMKLDVKSQAEAVALVSRRGWHPPPDGGPAGPQTMPNGDTAPAAGSAPPRRRQHFAGRNGQNQRFR